VLAYVTWAIVHLGAWGLMLLAAAGAGHLFLRKTQFHSFAERCVFTLSLGLGLWALAFFILGLVGGLYPAVILGLTIASAAGTGLHLVRVWKSKRLPPFPSLKDFRKPTALLGISLGIVAIGYWMLLLLLTQYPPVQWDATSNHLVLAKSYLEQHRIVSVMGVAQPVVPALNHMLFVWGLAMRDDILSQMMEHTLLMLVALGIYAWCARENRRLFGLAAACLWLAHPIIIWLGRAAYTDVGVTCFAFLGVYALRVFWNDRRAGWWYLSMSMLGMAAATKLSGLFFLALGGCFGFVVLAQSAKSFLLRRRRIGGSTTIESRPRAGSKSILLGWGLALLIATPWYGFIACETGSPLWPAFTELSRGVWGAPQVQANFAAMLKFAAGPRTLDSFLKLPFDWKYHSERFQAEVSPPLSPLMLLWSLAWIVALWRPAVRWWAAWALAFTLFWFLNAQQMRYWLPALPMAGLALYESIRWFIERFWKSAVFHNVIWAALILFTITWGSRRIVREVLIRGAPPVTASAREEFLARSYSGISAVKFINEYSSRDETVCVIGGSWLNYYLQPRVLDLVGPLYADSRPTFRPASEQRWMEWLESNGVTWIFIDHAEPQGLNIPKRDNITSAMEPDYQLVFADSEVWIFRRKPVPPDVHVSLKVISSVYAPPITANSPDYLANLIRLARASSLVSIGESKSILNFRLSANISNPSLSIPVIFTTSTDPRSRIWQ
jgi:hypothetical protein